MDKMLSCIIIEDLIPAQRVLQRYIADFGMLKLKATFNDAILALDFLKSEDVDVIFLDINLPKISGIDFLNILPKKQNIILTTAFSDYALKGYELDVVDYLLKPFSFQRFIKAVTKVELIVDSKIKSGITQTNAEEKHDYLFIKSGHEHIKIAYNDIDYIKADNDYTLVFTNTKKHLVSDTLSQWNERLESKSFCQVHKSFIVNINSIIKLSGNQIVMSDGIKIPIGRTYKESFLNTYIIP